MGFSINKKDTSKPEGFSELKINWSGLHNNADALAITEFATANPRILTVVLSQNSTSEERLFQALKFLAPTELREKITRFPSWETLPYDIFSPHQDIISDRLSALDRLISQAPGILIISIHTLMQRIATKEYLAGSTFSFHKGDRLIIEDQKMVLESAGYQNSEIVSERGQYATRGSILDIYPMGADLPIRLDLFDDEIDSLRSFDPTSQLTVKSLNSFTLLPAKEFPFDDEAIKKFRENWHNNFQGDVRRCSVYQDISSYISPSGIESYLPFFFDETGSVFDCLPTNAFFFTQEKIMELASNFENEIEERWESLNYDIERPILKPGQLYLTKDELKTELTRFKTIEIRIDDSKNAKIFESHPVPNFNIGTKTEFKNSSLNEFITNLDKPILFCSPTAGRREVLDAALMKIGIQNEIVETFDEYLTRDNHCICVSSITEGLWNEKALLITENELFGPQSSSQKEIKNKVIDPEQIIKNLNELSVGAPVVHLEHGVGRYLGLEIIEIEEIENEYLALAYSGGAKLYVPVASLHVISRYAGSDEEHAPLHKLGSSQWTKAKKKAAEKIIDVAAELLQAYAKREAQQSESLKIDKLEHQSFANEFNFELTQDQDLAISNVIQDLESPKAMDRLICGDVGFGKTEVAMRAAFVAAKCGRQVIMMVPTTLLAQQHYDTLKDRFAQWPFIIELVSRMRPAEELRKVGEACSEGRVDIVVGTHKILGKEFSFNKLGLIIIDEEHRFGVRQKEQLRAYRSQVDVLTLTATPIPRTLNMSLTGIRDLSIIATPPAKRLSIKTFVQERRTDQIKEAINRELMRGGQVFFVHNEVRTIERTAAEISALVPEARVAIGHGQMPKKLLEQVMQDFNQRHINVLVCTTIIENGIDVPNANTIIIDRADKFGLAQLHQLRGRVGRSSRQAYAYLITPDAEAITADAVKRLEAIQAAGDLGVGFTLATQDMEIRGAGELLGEEQSGQIESIGFSLYMQMLSKAVLDIEQGKIPDIENPVNETAKEINLHSSALIPEDYLPDVHTRLILYKRIANATTLGEIDSLQIEMIDRFGLLPDPLKRLFTISQLKLDCVTSGIITADLSDEGGKLIFSNSTAIDPLSIVELVQTESQTYQFEGTSTLLIAKALETFQKRVDFLTDLLNKLSNKETDVA